MGGKVKPWHAKRPKEYGKKIVPLRSGSDKRIVPLRVENDRRIIPLQGGAPFNSDDWDDDPPR